MFKTYDFSVDLSNIDRDSYIYEAAKLADELKDKKAVFSGNLKPDNTPASSNYNTLSSATIPKSDEGDIIRTLAQDIASFSNEPEVYKITGKDFIEKNRDIPHIFSQFSEDYNFYWIRFPINIVKKSGWAFNKLEAIIDFLADPHDPHRYPKVFQILPDKKHMYFIQANGSVAINIDENFQFAANPNIETKGLMGAAEVSAKSKTSNGLVVGPFKYSLNKAKMDHSDIGSQWLFWMLNGIEFVQDTSPDFVIITQLHKNTNKLNIRAQLQAYYDYSLLNTDLQTIVSDLPDTIRSYFIKGCPVRDIKEYHLDL
ncbi:hypothetical protein [Pseudobacteroides cellulosolvens]|uniref:Uncharacterized protein n=1 Tax=Pseudobacteroides cellulosolvens ATCC 35603 = DSM 2933 TaxID=398512 RepID=A0A0L6JL60_9FIRM|nr:hypothetical protein [Pseudobacteroides cellulosolvens]KNY26490.1 hypothetical protein Bccel_1755 [Pseudobacteroides cellulosolvens ATCC 35603 = DSM 2933]